MTLSKIFSISN